jgi:ATP-dependent RNA helicase RhlE
VFKKLNLLSTFGFIKTIEIPKEIPEEISEDISEEVIDEMPELPPPDGFEGLGITESLLSAIENLKYNEPTPVQKQAIPAAIEGKDIIAIAQTGTGKTIAFGIPMIQRLAESKGRGLIVVPTRELAHQVDAALKIICRAYKMQTTIIIGGVAYNPQVTALKKNPRIIIATPGRLLDHLKQKTVTLSDIEIFVLDEADRMLDMGFAPDINRIMATLTRKHQTMLFSATMPQEILAIARRHMDTPVYIEVARSGAAPEEISHELFFVDNRDKTRLLELTLQKRKGSALVFTRTKHGANKLAHRLKTMGHSVAEIHSNRSLNQRFSALDGFKAGNFRVLVATDIAARGIDVTDIALVINYDLPSTSEDYIHRIGRTGRAGRVGHAISFATFDQEKDIRGIENLLNACLPVSDLPFKPSQGSGFDTNRTERGRRPMARSRTPREDSKTPNVIPGTNREQTFGRHRVNAKGRGKRRG